MGARSRAIVTILLLLASALAGCATPGSDDAPNPASTDDTDPEEATLRLLDVRGLNVTLELEIPRSHNLTRATWVFATGMDPIEGNLTETHAYERPGRYTVTASAGNHTASRTVTVGDAGADGGDATTDPDAGDNATTPPPTPSPGTSATPYVVIAVIDTGINPYHAAFRRADLTAHPSTYIPTYPASAKPLRLTLDGAYNAEADADAFMGVERGGKDLRYVPGTNIIGAVSFGEYTDRLGGGGEVPILDENGHGTASAGVAAGRGYSAAPETTLLVMVEVGAGQFDEGIRWAAEQPWIDALSLSIGTVANVGAPGSIGQAAADATRIAAANGKLVFVASGNGVTNTGFAGDRCSTYTSGYTGPAWVTRVGAAVDDTGENQNWHCVPVDIIAEEYQPTAAHASADGGAKASGTSGATPTAAGYAAAVLAKVRAAYGDFTAGPDNGLLVRGPGGELDRDAFLHALYRAAEPVDTQPPSSTRAEPTHPASVATQGWGFLGPDAADRAVRALVAGEALPERPEEEAFFEEDHRIRVELWGSPP